jgi:hypothetical protein
VGRHLNCLAKVQDRRSPGRAVGWLLCLLPHRVQGRVSKSPRGGHLGSGNVWSSCSPAFPCQSVASVLVAQLPGTRKERTESLFWMDAARSK